MISKFHLKYKSSVVYLILSGYFFLFGYNVTHYHKYDYNFNFNCYLYEANDNKTSNKHLTYPGFQCPVHNTYTSVHNAILSAQDFHSSKLVEVELLRFYPQQFYFNNQFFSSNLLRAPPSLIS